MKNNAEHQKTKWNRRVQWLFIPGMALIWTGCGGAHMDISASQYGATQSSAVTYKAQIQPIFQSKCAICHNANSPIPNWLDYNVASADKQKIYDRVFVKKDMPQGNVTNMTDDERELVAEWVEKGAPEGTDEGVEPQPDPTQADPGPAPAPAPTVAPPAPVPAPAPTIAPPAPAPAPAPAPQLTYSRDILPIFTNRCKMCHNATSGSSMPNWMDYNTAFSFRALIKQRVVVKQDMPAYNATNMTAAERQKVGQWVDEGAPR